MQDLPEAMASNIYLLITFNNGSMWYQSIMFINASMYAVSKSILMIPAHASQAGIFKSDKLQPYTTC